MSESQVVLSFAEVAFLMALNGDAASDHACALLGVPVVPVDDPVAQAGVASLALRDLARQEQSGLVLAPQVAAVALGLVSPKSSATVATVTEDGDTILQLFVGEEQSLSVRPTAFGCFQFDGLRAKCKLEQLVESLLSEPLENRVTVARVNEHATITVTVDGESVMLSLDGEPARSVSAEALAAEVQSAVRACMKRSK